jgi:hypothetical protein
VGRLIKIPERTVPIEEYFLSLDARTSFSILQQLTPPELRRCYDKESALGNRRWQLIRIKKRLAQLALAKELADIIRTTAGQSEAAKKALRGRYRLTPRQIEQRIADKFKRPDTKQNRQRIYELTKKLQLRREELTMEAILKAQESGRQTLTKNAYRLYRKAVGEDHGHENLIDGSVCPLCGDSINRKGGVG